MTQQSDGESRDLTDAELLAILRDHGLSRRTLLTAVGVGAGAVALGGSAAGQTGRDASIDDVFGAAFSAAESPPRGLVDHNVAVRGPAAHGDGNGGALSRFPLVDSPEDGDFLVDSEEAEFYFDPVGLHVEPGDVVNFRVVEPHIHTVSAFHPKYEGLPPRIPEGATPFTSPPIGQDESWIYRFDRTGVYYVACLPHFPLGMVMVVVVFDPDRDDPSSIQSLPDLPPVGAFANANAVLNAPEISDPMAVVDSDDGRVSWDELSITLPGIDRIGLREVNVDATDAVFEANWEVSDSGGDLSSVQLRLTDQTDDGSEEDTAMESVSGASASGTTRLVAAGDEDASHTYQVTLVVRDGDGMFAVGTATARE